MDIWEIMDCEDCESYFYIPGKTSGDPDSCYPDEAVCKNDAPESGPCKRMLGAIEDLLYDGELYTMRGKFWTSECLQEMQKSSGWEDWNMPDHLRDFDFSSAPYWHICDEYGTASGYNSISDIYYEWFQ